MPFLAVFIYSVVALGRLRYIAHTVIALLPFLNGQNMVDIHSASVEAACGTVHSRRMERVDKACGIFTENVFAHLLHGEGT